MMRRLLGVAQLPLSASLARKRALLERARGAAARMSPTRVWIDTDPAVGVPEPRRRRRLRAAAGAALCGTGGGGGLNVFGNTDLERAHAIAAELLHLDGHGEMSLHPGATEAGALRDPAAAAHVERVVEVAGRRPGQRFQVGTGGDALPDFTSRAIFRRRRAAGPRGPRAAAGAVRGFLPRRIGEPELRALEAGPSTARWLVPPSQRWLEHWREHFGVDWFHPFDTLAVTAVATPELIELEAVEVEVVRRRSSSCAPRRFFSEGDRAATRTPTQVPRRPDGAAAELTRGKLSRDRTCLRPAGRL